GLEGVAVAPFNAIIKSNGRKAFLTFPRSNPPSLRAGFVSAYDVDDFTQKLVGAELEGSLLAVAEPDDLPLDAPDSAGSSTLIILSNNSIIFKGVSSNFGVWQLVRGSLLEQAPAMR